MQKYLVVLLLVVILVSGCGLSDAQVQATVTAKIATSDAIKASIKETQSSATYNLLTTQGQSHFVVVDKGLGSDRSALKDIADEICKGKMICIIFFWDDNSKAASRLPMTDAQVNAKVAQYNLNKNTGLDRLLICASGGC